MAAVTGRGDKCHAKMPYPSQSLAEWRRRAVDWKCAPGLARSCDHFERATPETFAERLHPVFSTASSSSRVAAVVKLSTPKTTSASVEPGSSPQ